ncbi:uncharacterized protein LOC143490958 isoform X2 [Brachyhypopomus gauderio]|uniref:uncharacterized protein LOC143490958 isoform X2 n=1 Tax=Brachyhypopomus gauderio TaxID=698409 RepID=UPI004040F364
MAETVRSLFDYRDPPTLDSDGEGSKPPPPRGRGCGRKRKGTPVKVCDRVFAAEDDEESTSEHSYGPGDREEGKENKHRPAAEGSYYSESTQTCSGDMEEGSSSGRGSVLFPPPPNCRIREVHCGNQVRLVVIAIRDITKGEEITVDYSLTEWGENAMGFRGTVPPAGFECLSDHENNIKKEDESAPVALSEYLTPSWSLSPSCSPVSHSEPSDSDHDSDDAGADMRGRAPRRRKKRKPLSPPAANGKRKTPHRPPVRPPSMPRSLPSTPPQPAAPSRPVFKCPAPAGVAGGAVRVGAGRGVSATVQKQCCVYCGRHYRSLPRHLDKHHAHQPDVLVAMERAHTSAHLPHLHASLPSSSSSSSMHSHCHRDAPGHRVVVATQQSLPLASPARRSPALSSPSRKSPAPPPVTPPRRGGVPVSVLKRSPPTPATPPRKVGRKVKKEKEEIEVVEKTKEEEVPVAVFVEPVKEAGPGHPKTEEEESIVREDDSGAEDKSDLSSSRRPHMLPLLSSLSSLVLYLRRLQHSALISLSRSPQSAEAWRLLCHSSLALLILYNRRRECEVSKLTISEYQSRVIPHPPVAVLSGAPPALTPLEASLSPFERLVLPHLPRVGVQGKRGRVQPLILPPHSEACLELLLQTRPGVGVDPQNPYVFARPYHSPATPLRGTDLLRSLAKSSGTRHPRALTQTRVRRQVAILTQLLLLSEGEEDGHRGAATLRLESFLQKEYHVTQSCATIGQDPGLMGLIGRVVLCGERDGVLFRGMSLHHICLELDVMSGNSADSLSEDSEGEPGKEKTESASIMIKKTSNNSKSPRPKKMNASHPSPGRKRGSGQPKPGKRGVLKRPWTEAERAAVESHLVRNIMELRVPAKADCERCLEQCPLLVTNHRDWRAIKFYCHNRIQLLKKTQQRQSPPTLSVC